MTTFFLLLVLYFVDRTNSCCSSQAQQVCFFLRPPTFRRIGETAPLFLETRYEVTYVRYLHRVGRAGRFGTKGLAITFVSTEEDTEILNQVELFGIQIKTSISCPWQATKGGTNSRATKGGDIFLSNSTGPCSNVLGFAI